MKDKTYDLNEFFESNENTEKIQESDLSLIKTKEET